jgi:hypothetical protein
MNIIIIFNSESETLMAILQGCVTGRAETLEVVTYTV